MSAEFVFKLATAKTHRFPNVHRNSSTALSAIPREQMCTITDKQTQNDRKETVDIFVTQALLTYL